jgi:chitinase
MPPQKPQTGGEETEMLVRNAARATCLFVLALVFTAAAPAASRDRTPPTAPTNLRITASSDTSITLAWNKASDNSSNWWYCVQKSGLGCFRVDPPKTTFTMTRLMPDTTTHWSVVAIDAAGNRSKSSNVVTYTTPPDTTPPSPPPVLSATSVVPTRIQLSWTGSTDNTSQVWYTLFKDGIEAGTDILGFRTNMFIHLTPSTTYTFHVTARDRSGNTTTSNVLTVTTPPKRDDVAPSPPGNLRLSSESQAPEAWLEWDQSTDDTDPQSQILYEIFVNGQFAFESWVIGWDSTIAYCRVDGAVNTIVARAVDTSGNVSAPSNEIHFPC